MKSNNTTSATLKGMAKHTYNRVMSAMAEDSEPSMCHTFAVLTEGAKSIALQSGKFSNLYVRGERKGMTAEEAAKELTERAAGCVSRKLRKIDMICAVAFLAEYISRQRKAIETPETPNPDNPPSTMNASEIVASLNEKQVRAAAAKLLPAKFFDEYFTPECGNIALIRDMLEDHVFEYDMTATEIMEAAGADENANKTKAPEFSELTHAGQCLHTYLHNTADIYDRYTAPEIAAAAERMRINARTGEHLWHACTPESSRVTNAISNAIAMVQTYDHLIPTAQDIELVTRNYVAYIVKCAK